MKTTDRPIFALYSFDGIVQEVYKIEAWFPAGSTFYGSRDGRSREPGRWEFVGRIADSRARSKYLCRRLLTCYPMARRIQLPTLDLSFC